MLDTPGTFDSACGCGPKCDSCDTDGPVALKIVWQRLVSDEGETCPRCGTTQAAVQQAVNTLAEALLPLGIEPMLETRELDLQAFEAAPIESNRIWIADQPLEAWIGADVGSTRCCTVCGDNDCRALELDGTTFEVIPERLIVKAGLAAASSLLRL